VLAGGGTQPFLGKKEKRGEGDTGGLRDRLQRKKGKEPLIYLEKGKRKKEDTEGMER